MQLCSIALPSDLPRVRVLVESLARHAPGSPQTVLYVDPHGGAPPQIPGADVLALDTLDLDPTTWLRWQLTRDLRGLVETIKPHFLRHLLPADGALVCVDPTRLAIGPVAPPMDVPSGLGLLARVVEPIRDDGLEPSEATLARLGVVDPGIVVAGPGAAPVLDWWAERVAADASTAWLDLALGIFPDRARLLSAPAWNVSTARLQTRTLERAGADVLLAGERVALLDLTGFDPGRPWLVDARQTRDLRTKVSRDPVLRDVLKHYAAELMGACEDLEATATEFSSVDEVVADDIVQTLVRQELLAASRGRGSGLTLDAGSAPTIREWLTLPDPTSGGPGNLGRYLAEFYRRRLDLQGVYPEVRSGDVTGYLDWTELVGIASDDIPRWIVEAANRQIGRGPDVATSDVSRSRPQRLVPGVEVVGYLSADLGIGQAARMLVAGLERAAIPVSTRTYTRTSSRLGAEWHDRPAPEGGRHDTVVICLNADMLPTFLHDDAEPGFCDGRRVIGFWFWELDDFPPSMRPALEPLDEVWVTSTFTADVLRQATDKPVHVLPLPVHSPERSETEVPELAGDDSFTFLFVFDYLSVFQRKNPLGLVAAFEEAFPEQGEARLVIKTINRDKRPDHAEHLAHAIGDRRDVVVIDRYLSRAELDALMWRADCYVSLHRSEGFGFTMAEEMAIGKPVIATGYSGNMEFMTPANSRPVRFDMVRVPPGAEPYPEGSSWAEPRRGHTVTAMRRIRDEEPLRARIGQAAAATIAEQHSVEALSRALGHRLRADSTEAAGDARGRPSLRSRLRKR